MQNILLSGRLDFQAGCQSKKGKEDDKMTCNSKSKATLQICLFKRLDTPEKGILYFHTKKIFISVLSFDVGQSRNLPQHVF